MGACFDRWLIRPSTLRFLRQPVDPTARANCCPRNRLGPNRWVATIAATLANGEDPRDERTEDNKSGRHHRPVQRLHHTADEALMLSVKEMSTRMSLSSGVTLLQGKQTNAASFNALRFQADVDSGPNDARLVDQAAHKDDARLWVELLQFRQRLDGNSGVLAVWEGMRGRSIDLPTSGHEAHILWTAVIEAVMSENRDRDLLQGVINHALDVKSRTGLQYEQLYKRIVGTFFRVKDSGAKLWHVRLVEMGLAPSDALKQVAYDAVRTRTPVGTIQTFKKMYTHGKERELYDAYVGEALSVGISSVALKWHRVLLKLGEAPSQEMFARSDVQRLFELDGDLALPIIHKKRIEIAPSPEEGSVPQYPPMTRATMSTLVGDVHGIKAKEISDNFVAKLFATRAFPLDMLIRGLSFFAIDTIGPLAVREMAIRAGSHVEFCNKLFDLKKEGILLGGSAYARLLRKLATEGQTELYHALLASDQHPEEYDNTDSQQRLLASFLAAGDWTQAHLTVLCLSLTGSAQQAKAWNAIIQHYLQSRQYRLVVQTIQHLQAQKSPLTTTTLTFLHRYVLPVRRLRMRPVESQRRNRPPFDALAFVTNAAMYAEEISGKVGVRVWQELLKRYGMAHRWPELTRLILWLCTRYSHARFRLPGIRLGGWPRLLASNPLHKIFDTQMQKAIFTWGFRCAAVRFQRRPDPPGVDASKQNVLESGVCLADSWTQGLIVLQQLRRHGVVVHDRVVSDVFLQRMWILFGPGYSSLAINEMIRRTQWLSLACYVRTGNEVWGNLARAIPSELLVEDGDAGTDARLRLALFGPYGYTGKRENGEREYADVLAWAHVASRPGAHQRALYRGHTARQRPRVWERSPFRFTSSTKLPKVHASFRSLRGRFLGQRQHARIPSLLPHHTASTPTNS